MAVAAAAQQDRRRAPYFLGVSYFTAEMNPSRETIRVVFAENRGKNKPSP
jgi:hypothetical protein